MALFFFALKEGSTVSPVTRARWVTFDCYGTLVDWNAGFSLMVSRVAGDRAAEVVRGYDACERAAERARGHRPYKTVVIDCVREAAAAANVPIVERDLLRLPALWRLLRPFDDVESMLSALRRRGYRLAVLANCDDDLFEVTHRTFRVPFDLFVTSERVRGYKPLPWQFRAFEMLTGVARADWVHVGCSWDQDIAPAEAVGFARVWLDRESRRHEDAGAAVRVTSAGAVADAVDRLMGVDRRGSAGRAGAHDLRGYSAVARC
jgi:2-haloacid dehalogenase